MRPRVLSRFIPALTLLSTLAAEPTPEPTLSVAPAINALGLDLYRQQIKGAEGKGVLLSPYAIATALAMTYAGADGETKAEMHKVLHLPSDQAAGSTAFHDLAEQLAEMVRTSTAEATTVRKEGGEITAVQLDVANRLFVQRDYALRQDFLDDMHAHFAASPESLDFKADPELARKTINHWVAEQTHDKIIGLLPEGQPTKDTRLTLVNALYLRAPWEHKFEPEATELEAFRLRGGQSAPVPTMLSQRFYGYAKQPGYTVVTLPYWRGKLQFVLIVPDRRDGLETVEKQLTIADLKEFTHLKDQLVQLHLPRFKLVPDSLSLGGTLQALGLKTAFDQPRGSANFDRMASRRPDDYLYIGEVVHKTWLSLDEHGTEAAAATAVIMLSGFGVSAQPPTPIEVRADHPFLFAIQHVDSGVCLFLGRVTDPRAN